MIGVLELLAKLKKPMTTFRLQVSLIGGKHKGRATCYPVTDWDRRWLDSVSGYGEVDFIALARE